MGSHQTAVPEMPAPIARPPLVIAAHGPIGLRAAARYADTWNCLGGQRYKAGPNPDTSDGWRTLPQCVAETERLMARLDEACAEVGRDSATLGRSVLALNPSIDPFASLDAFDEYTGAYAHLGLEEMTLYWPRSAVYHGSCRRRTTRPASSASRHSGFSPGRSRRARGPDECASRRSA